MAPGIVGVNGYFAFACWNQALTDESQNIVDMISRTILLPFGHRVDEMEVIRVPDDRQPRSVVISPSFCSYSRLITLWKPLLFPIDFSQ
jgi:hypothetical protein